MCDWQKDENSDLIHQQGCFTSPTSISLHKTVARFYTYCYLQQAPEYRTVTLPNLNPVLWTEEFPQSKTFLASSCNSNTGNIRLKVVIHVYRYSCNLCAIYDLTKTARCRQFLVKIPSVKFQSQCSQLECHCSVQVDKMHKANTHFLYHFLKVLRNLPNRHPDEWGSKQTFLHKPYI